MSLPVDHGTLRRFLARHHRHEARPLLPEPHHVRPVPHREVGRHANGGGVLKRYVETNSRTVSAGSASRWCSRRSRFASCGPNGQWYATALALGGLVCTLLYILSQWREIGRDVLRPPGALRLARRGERPRGPRHPRRDQLPGEPPQQALGSDRGAVSSRCRIRPRSCCRGCSEPVAGHRLRADGGLPALPRALDQYLYEVGRQAEGRVHRSREATGNGGASWATTARSAPSFSTTTDACSASPPTPEQDLTNGLIKVIQGTQREGLLHPGPRRARHHRHRRRRATAASPKRSAATTSRSRRSSSCSRQIPDDAKVLAIAGPSL